MHRLPPSAPHHGSTIASETIAQTVVPPSPPRAAAVVVGARARARSSSSLGATITQPASPRIRKMCSDTGCCDTDCIHGLRDSVPTPDMVCVNDGNQSVCNLMEEEKPVLHGVNIRAATVERLLHLCVESFGDDGIILENSEYPGVMFLMHKWYTTSDELAQSFLELYQKCDEVIPCPVQECAHLPTAHTCAIQIFKAKICYAVRYWIRQFPVQFDLDSKLQSVIKAFGTLVQHKGNSTFRELIDLSKVPSYDWMRSISVRNPSMRHNRKVSLVFNHLEPEELADHLTYLEYRAFRRINFTDFKNYAMTASLKDNPKLERSIALFNGLSQWIQCMVLSKTTPQQRADVIVKFCNVAKKLRLLQNFNSLMAVIGGLTHSALARLYKTTACIPSETQKMLMEYTELLSSNNNFSNYRKVFHQCAGFKIPILGVHLKDLILLHTALPDRVEGNLINFRKMAQLSLILRELTKLQTHDSIPGVYANMDLINTLRLSLDMHYTEDEIYELSLAREPRNSLSSPSTPTKPVVFAEWVAGMRPPDPQTINKHVRDMVEAVFKNYDNDRDGFISHAEFEAIAGNFPFIDSFCVLDADQDGMISKAEMKTYFIRANCHALRNSFKHDFHEITYFKPTFCIHCTGLLWGLIKQGWKCKDCGINAHKHCKDLVVMECRSKTSVACNRRLDSLSSNGSGSQDLSYSSKRKMSQRQKRTRVHRGTQTEECYFDVFPRELEEGGEFRELHERLSKAEEARDKLKAENEMLTLMVNSNASQIAMLKSQIVMIRKTTVSFILEQMDALHIQRDSQV
ncbi:ras guanyl-releasing protein 3-like isoform X4 [Dreissena polymorpha]|uniref:ras guanyl-releasing protein 3-like isoform X2 n=1 Tax=Dreissena polymorpha TaxID=45954 RepID=UPI002264ADCB|nr:ras guanyl-releasing protein 3-like isoform X2 [Dreissena polymorpha]XP_052275429.1 ras guanyl-releasing protein 3-like isoform X3 [Dreissena polymorpha]XP_052275430.1 ras guanyl-releasing protein 3-like isoform X4 [Dreissena polymorpha]